METPRGQIVTLLQEGDALAWRSASAIERDDLAKFVANRFGGSWVAWRAEIDKECTEGEPLRDAVLRVGRKWRETSVLALVPPHPMLPEPEVIEVVPVNQIEGTPEWLAEKGTLELYLKASDLSQEKTCQIIAEGTRSGPKSWRWRLSKQPKRRHSWKLDYLVKWIEPPNDPASQASEPQVAEHPNDNGYRWVAMSRAERINRAKAIAAVLSLPWRDIYVGLNGFYGLTGEETNETIMSMSINEAATVIAVLIEADVEP